MGSSYFNKSTWILETSNYYDSNSYSSFLIFNGINSKKKSPLRSTTNYRYSDSWNTITIDRAITKDNFSCRKKAAYFLGYVFTLSKAIK